ncbi:MULTISPECIES: type II CRISPR-associated endonuclease Cas1 [Anoxybacillus]|uniref:CRISPR-associated endonuclease Cas1 n=2 Tax=Anoxybacillaceae TaxID=3120669 RepID=A0AAX2A1I3_9BACL|nr:type II CRISPR-associated endonuclease Cas1 [Anoxybacillus flavithermus]MBE2908621.1 type II CRISPR-associated endonuclease Cas1 [Anoxybacillus flavithermus]MBE2911320.1 type II CRISPR-associated endonuclease Cas1 [Anoxybacillus flavithermus]MBE2924561.1 type II CRISPR-associated endonuclease Cas1 [Anoxybacillus flavithermus]MBE2927946.1 type II CRISPR-associated endonuclease Cas1 [Anoxybacillus flavithermus]MBE2935173.1 type II CRISPR-associated endonuclease Cas1 [Anoxybacillus flavithermu
MGWRHVMIRKPSKLSIRYNQLVIEQEDTVSIPLEDLCSIIIEEHAVTITAATLSKMAECNIALFTCDQKRLPNGLLNTFQKHSRQLSVLQMQYTYTKPFKKRIWQQIVTQKLTNQGKCLEFLSKDGADDLYRISKTVDSGDTNNREAYGAKKYFRYLFGEGFNRRNDNTINIALNYGYAIMRGIVARSLVNYGFFPCIGIYHDNELNKFNLADDFMEVLRPLVDLHVAQHIQEDDEFSSSIRADLYNLVNADILMDKEKLTVTNAVEEMVKSFVTASRNEKPSFLKLPELLPIQIHTYE